MVGWGGDGNAKPGGIKSGALKNTDLSQEACCIIWKSRTPKERTGLLRLQLRTMIVEISLVIQEALLVFFQVLQNPPMDWPTAMLCEAHVKSLGPREF